MVRVANEERIVWTSMITFLIMSLHYIPTKFLNTWKNEEDFVYLQKNRRSLLTPYGMSKNGYVERARKMREMNDKEEMI